MLGWKFVWILLAKLCLLLRIKSPGIPQLVTKVHTNLVNGWKSGWGCAERQTVRWHWQELFGKSIKKTFSGQVIGNTLQIFSSAIVAVMTTALLWFGAWLVIQNELIIGQLVAFNIPSVNT